METLPLPENEAERLQSLIDYSILDTQKDPVFDNVTQIAASVCDTPLALISLIDSEREWFKSIHGFFDLCETPRQGGFCAHAILQKELMEIPDIREDQRFCHHPMVVNAPHIRFYAGMPIINSEAHALGAICVIDHQPRTLTDAQRNMLKQLAQMVMVLLEAHKNQLNTQAALKHSIQRFKDFAQISTDWFWETDAKHRYTWFSENVETITGVSREWHYGKTRQEIAAVDTHSQEWQNHLAQLDDQQPFRNFELCRRAPDGVRWIRSSGMPIFDEDGTFKGYRGTGSDITRHKLAEYKLHENEKRLRLITDSLPVLIAYYDTGQHYQFINKTFEQWFQRSRQSILGAHVEDVIGSEAYQVLKPYMEEALTGKQVYFEAERPRPDGETIHVQGFYIPDCNEQNETIGVYALTMDISERKQLENKLFEQKERAQITLESIGDGVITTNAKGVVEYLNPVAEQLTGWTKADACQHPIEDVFNIISEDTRKPVINPIRVCLEKARVAGLENHTILFARDGREYSIQDKAAPIRDRKGKISGAVLVFSDITQDREIQRKLAYQATHDALTGLVNRAEFEHRLQRLLSSTSGQHSQHALCYLDLDKFKVVNDSCGHAAGDELLRQLAKLFRQQVRQRDTIARLGGDEFAMLLEYCSSEQALRIAHAVCDAVAGFSFHWQQRTFQPGVSVGLVPINTKAKTMSEVLNVADQACYAAKKSGGNFVRVAHLDD